MPKSLVAGRVPESWAAELKQIGNDTGKNQSEMVAEAISMYLGKTDSTSVASMARRLNTLEKKLKRLAALV